MDNTIGMLGPATPAELADLLDVEVATDRLPPGIGGPPVSLLTRELLRRGRRVVLFTLDKTISEEAVLRGPRLTVCVW